MKFYTYSAIAAVLLAFPVISCSCNSNSTPENKEETPVPTQESPAKGNPQTGEIKTEEPAPAPAPEVKPAPAPEAKPAPATEAKPADKAPKSEPAPVEVKETKNTVPPCEHTVRTGDSLWKISRQYYGSGAKWKLILDANKAKIKKADFLEPGTVLSIPAAK